MAGTTRSILMACLTAVAIAGQPLMAQEDDVVERSFCVFDPVGANGPLFNLMQSARPMALENGVDLELRAYTSEKIAAEEFRNGQCDSVLITGTMARDFNRFTGTIEAMGALPGQEEMRMMMQVLSQDNARKYLQTDKYEVVGVLPAGAINLYLDDRRIDSVDKLQGKRIATMDHDKAAITLVRHVGGSVVGSSTSNFSGRFNNGSVDVAYAPAVAYEPLELYRGLGDDGGIMDYNVAQMTFQILVRRERFPEKYITNIRDYAFSRVDEAYEIIADAKSGIKDSYWMSPTQQERNDYDAMLQQVRQQLRDEGEFDETALRLMKGIRCRVDGSRAECASTASND
jgi:hypothetical protein